MRRFGYVGAGYPEAETVDAHPRGAVAPVEPTVDIGHEVVVVHGCVTMVAVLPLRIPSILKYSGTIPSFVRTKSTLGISTTAITRDRHMAFAARPDIYASTLLLPACATGAASSRHGGCP
jgi:hypothetical protein